MAETYRPRDAAETLDFLRWAAAEEKPLEIVGRGSKRGLGRPVQAELTLDMAGVAGIELYEPEELVLTLRPGTPVAEVEALLAAREQELAFEPIDYGPLLGLAAEAGTIGGAVAANLAGPRRLSKGAARDHMLGIKAVSGRGEAFKSGGRVVKNVTGYDLSRGLAGSWGTLAVTTEMTLKVLPKAETSVTMALFGLEDAAAVAALAAAMGSSAEASGAAHLPSAAAVAIGGEIGRPGRSATLVRLEGIPVSIDYRARILDRVLAPWGKLERLGEAVSVPLWRAIRDVRPLWPDLASDAFVWRLSTAPTSGPGVVASIAAGIAGTAVFYDWQGGLVWLAVPKTTPEAGAATIRAAVAAAGGGHATLVRADAATRAAIPPFEPQPAPLAALAARLKAEFDPKGILNPGRMAAR